MDFVMTGGNAMSALIQKSVEGIPYWEMPVGAVQATTPIVLALHYMTGDLNAMRFIFNDFPAAVRVILMQAEYPSGDPLGGYSWFPGELDFYEWGDARQAPEIRIQVDRIAAVVRAVQADYPAPTAVTGMSQGGDLTLGLVAYYPELFSLAVPVAGRLSAPMHPTQFERAGRSLPRVALKLGEKDHIVSVAATQEATDWLQAAGYAADLQVYPGVEHELEPMAEDVRAALLAWVG
jgi:predicted esterase